MALTRMFAQDVGLNTCLPQESSCTSRESVKHELRTKITLNTLALNPAPNLTLPTGSSSDTPNFFASTKLLACLDLQHSQELYEAAQMVRNLGLLVFRHVANNSRSQVFDAG